jgi:hypothetical protein
LPAALFTVSTTPFPLLLLLLLRLAVERDVLGFELRVLVLRPLLDARERLLVDREALFAGLRVALFFGFAREFVERFVLFRWVLAAIGFLLLRACTSFRIAYPIGAAKTQRAETCSGRVRRHRSG